jgi:tetratricopeptide (TPR) repeat protein
VERLPFPEYVIALAETEQAAGRIAAARRDYDLVRAEADLLRANGVNTDVELALFEANHGSAQRGVALGRRAWRAAPSVRSADAYAWALSAAGRDQDAHAMSHEAMRLGSSDPLFLYHAGMIARRAGDLDTARDLLGRLVAQSPRFSPLYGPIARRALERIG